MEQSTIFCKSQTPIIYRWFAAVLLCVCATFPLHADEAVYAYAKATGGANGLDLAADTSGNHYVTGSFNGTADFDPGAGVVNVTAAGGTDIYISKLDAAGQLLWVRTMGGASFDHSLSVAVDTDGDVYIAGVYGGTVDFDPGVGVSSRTSAGYEDIFVAKFDAAGNFLWVWSAPGATENDRAMALVIDDSNNVYVAGYFWGTVDFDPGVGNITLVSAGRYDGFISKLDAAGNTLWAKSVGGAGDEMVTGLALDSSAQPHITGSFWNGADFDPGPGISTLTAGADTNIFVSKLDATGNLIWARGMGGGSSEASNDIAVDSNANVFTIGYFNSTVDFDPGAGVVNQVTAGSSDIFVSKLDAAGNFVWVKTYGGTSNDTGESVAVDAADRAYIVGSFSGDANFGATALSSAGNTDMFIARLESAGNTNWIKRIGGASSDTAYAALTDTSDAVFITGNFRGAVDFDPNWGEAPLVAAASGDVFLLKLQQLTASACTPGNYWNGASCVDANPGYYVPAAGALSQIPCAVGTYQPAAATAACINASVGHHVSLAASTAQTACVPGYYQPAVASASCIPATPGYFVSGSAAIAQVQCSAGTSSGAAATSCSPINDGDSDGVLNAGYELYSTTFNTTGSEWALSSWTVVTSPTNYIRTQPKTASTNCFSVGCSQTFTMTLTRTLSGRAAISFWGMSTSASPITLGFLVDNVSAGTFSFDRYLPKQATVVVPAGTHTFKWVDSNTNYIFYVDDVVINILADNCPSVANANQLDSDADGAGDVCDAFPLSAAESLDTDSDGIGNNADLDDDGDGVPDYIDAAPLNAANASEVTLPLNSGYKGSAVTEQVITQ